MAKIIEFFNLKCVPKFFDTVHKHGGWKSSLYKLYRMDSLKDGELIGTDKFGNKYYENKNFFYGRSRWVEYAPYYALEYDASQIPAEWFGWMHYKTDWPPFCDKSRPKYKWMLDHEENLSGTAAQFYPYSTTRQRIYAWVPPKEPLKGDAFCKRLTPPFREAEGGGKGSKDEGDGKACTRLN